MYCASFDHLVNLSCQQGQQPCFLVHNFPQLLALRVCCSPQCCSASRSPNLPPSRLSPGQCSQPSPFYWLATPDGGPWTCLFVTRDGLLYRQSPCCDRLCVPGWLLASSACRCCWGSESHYPTWWALLTRQDPPLGSSLHMVARPPPGCSSGGVRPNLSHVPERDS